MAAASSSAAIPARRSARTSTAARSTSAASSGRVGTDAEQVELEAAEEEDVLAFLDRYEMPFHGKLQKIVNAGKNLHYPRTEPRVRVIPFFAGSERTRLLERQGAGGHLRQGADRPLPDPRLRRRPAPPALSTTSRSRTTSPRSTPDPDVVSQVELATSVGGRFGATPIDLSMPVMIAPMSYGALSKSTKIALANASALSDICDNSGEGGTHP